MGGQLAEQDRAGLVEAADGGRVPLGHAELADPRLAGRRDPAGVVDILGGVRHTVQRTPVGAARDLVFGHARLGQRTLAGDANEGVEDGVECRDPREKVLRPRHGGERAGADQRRSSRDGQVVKLVAHVPGTSRTNIFPFSRLQPAPPLGRPKHTIPWADGRGCGLVRFHDKWKML